MEQNLPSVAPPAGPPLCLAGLALWLAACSASPPPPGQPGPSTNGDISTAAGRGSAGAATDRAIGPPLAIVDAESAPRTNGDLLRNPDFHQAMDDVRRLRLV